MDAHARARLNAAFVRLADGDRTVAREAFDLLWPVVRRFCARSLGESHGDDAAQQALVRLFEQASDYDRTRDALAWALEIAVWQCRTERKRRTRSREEALEVAADRASPGASPEEGVEARQLGAALESVIDELAPIDRDTLRAVLDGSGDGSATWRKRKERALARLRLAWRTVHGD